MPSRVYCHLNLSINSQVIINSSSFRLTSRSFPPIPFIKCLIHSRVIEVVRKYVKPQIWYGYEGMQEVCETIHSIHNLIFSMNVQENPPSSCYHYTRRRRQILHQLIQFHGHVAIDGMWIVAKAVLSNRSWSIPLDWRMPINQPQLLISQNRIVTHIVGLCGNVMLVKLCTLLFIRVIPLRLKCSHQLSSACSIKLSLDLV